LTQLTLNLQQLGSLDNDILAQLINLKHLNLTAEKMTDDALLKNISECIPRLPSLTGLSLNCYKGDITNDG